MVLDSRGQINSDFTNLEADLAKWQLYQLQKVTVSYNNAGGVNSIVIRFALSEGNEFWLTMEDTGALKFDYWNGTNVLNKWTK